MHPCLNACIKVFVYVAFMGTKQVGPLDSQMLAAVIGFGTYAHMHACLRQDHGTKKERPLACVFSQSAEQQELGRLILDWDAFARHTGGVCSCTCLCIKCHVLQQLDSLLPSID
jgi:hypothetical protein